MLRLVEKLAVSLFSLCCCVAKKTVIMTKLQLLHRALNERLMAAVEQIMEMVGGTVLEYEEETIRARKENEVLRRRLRWMEGANPADWPGPSESITLSTPDESNPSQQDESAPNFGLGQESEALVIKTETTDHPLYSGTTLPQSNDQGSDIAGTSSGIGYSLVGGMTWDSAQNYMAPLDFDPTSGTTRVGHWRGQNRRQRMSFACPDCGKVFGREHSLMIHMRIHSAERPYKYRRRKAFFYGDNKKRKRQGLSQLSSEIVDDLSDCSEQTNRSSASPERLAITSRDQEEPGGLSTETDHTSSDKEPKNRTTTPARHQLKKKKGEKTMPCHCPHCPDREFARPCQLANHMKTHTALLNLPRQAQSGTDNIMDVKMKSSKKQRKNDAAKKAKVAGESVFPCPKCDRVCSSATRLRLHMKSHRSEKALLCKRLKMIIQTEPCKAETAEVVPKTTEVQNLQELKKTYACPHCDKVFIREGWLEPHIRSQHRTKQFWKSQFDSGQTRAQLLYSQKLRNSRTKKRRVTKKPKQKNEESKKISAKPSQSRDESNLVVAGYTQQLRVRATKKQGVTEESKQKKEESKNVNNEPSPSIDESDLVADVPKMPTDEAEQSADLPKMGLESKDDTSDCGREISITTKLKRIFPCKVCGKEFIREKKLKKHSRKHIGRRLHDEKKRKREQTLREKQLLEQTAMEKEEDNNDKTCNHKLNTTPQGSPNKELLQKGKTRGQGPLPCPFCGKVFAWEMRLMMHMQIHCGEKPYSYRQRKRHFYGDLKRGQLPKIHNQEPPGNNSDKSEESVGEETINEDGSTHLSGSTTCAMSGALASGTETSLLEDYTGSLGLLPQTAIEHPTTCNKSNQSTKPNQFSDITSHFSLQPRIVLEPITTESKYWSSVSGDLKSGPSERIGFDHEQTSCSVLVDTVEMADAVEDEIVRSNLCMIPVESSGHGIQNKAEICHSVVPVTEIVSVEVGSPQCALQSEVELDNFGRPLAVESSELNNTESHQKEGHDCYFLGVSKKTTINQLPLIIIDDELEQSNARTAAEHSPSECGRTKCDCNSISAMKLTVMPQTSDLESLFKETSSGDMLKIDSELVCVVLSDVEDDVDEDVLNPKKTASVPRIQNEHLDVCKQPGENAFNDSNSSAPGATESIKTDESTCTHAKSVDGASKHTDVEVVTSERNDMSISNDPLTRDQMASITIGQTEDNPMSSTKETSCQTSKMVFADQDSLSEVKVDKKLLDMEIVNDDERKNMNLGVNNQVHNSSRLESTMETQK